MEAKANFRILVLFEEPTDQPGLSGPAGLARLLEEYDQHRSMGQGRDCVVPSSERSAWRKGIEHDKCARVRESACASFS